MEKKLFWLWISIVVVASFPFGGIPISVLFFVYALLISLPVAAVKKIIYRGRRHGETLGFSEVWGSHLLPRLILFGKIYAGLFAVLIVLGLAIGNVRTDGIFYSGPSWWEFLYGMFWMWEGIQPAGGSKGNWWLN